MAYVYLPDTGLGGHNSFNQYYFAQVGREGAIIDEPFNEGGSAPDYIIDHLRRLLHNYWMTREGRDFSTPSGAIFGPKVMVTNMYAGSGGDVLPWYFREAQLGPWSEAAPPERLSEFTIRPGSWMELSSTRPASLSIAHRRLGSREPRRVARL